LFFAGKSDIMTFMRKASSERLSAAGEGGGREAKSIHPLDEMTAAEYLMPENRELFAERCSQVALRATRGFLNGRATTDHDYEDVAQEATLKATIGLSSFRGEGKLTSWVFRIAINEAYSWLRKRHADRRGADTDLYLEELFFAGQNNPAAGTDPEALMIQEQQVTLFREAIENLKEEERTVLMLHLDDWTDEQIAGASGMKVETVKSRLHRARLHLLDRLMRRGLAPGEEGSGK
jgi:RNA polymerase sigma-70 factor (ECF subfamily)